MDNNSKQSGHGFEGIPFGAIAGCGIALASLCFLVLSLSGAMAHYAEWQFAQLGYNSPLAPMVLFTILFSGAGYIVMWLLRSRRNGRVASSSEQPNMSQQQWRQVFLWTAFASSLFGLVAAIQLMLLPVSLGATKVVSSKGFDLTKVGDGPVVLNGFSPRGQMVRFTRGFLGWQQDIYLVPLGGQGNLKAPASLFVQVSESAAKTSMPLQFTGILQREALPYELLPLANAVGLKSSPRPAVLFLDHSSMAYGHVLTLLIASVIAIMAAAAGWFLGRQTRTDPTTAD